MRRTGRLTDHGVNEISQLPTDLLPEDIKDGIIDLVREVRVLRHDNTQLQIKVEEMAGMNHQLEFDLMTAYGKQQFVVIDREHRFCRICAAAGYPTV